LQSEPDRDCEICLEESKTVAFNPCGHGACLSCAGVIRECHICRSKIIGKIKLYFWQTWTNHHQD